MAVRTSRLRLRSFLVKHMGGESPAESFELALPFMSGVISQHGWNPERTLYVQFVCGCIVVWRFDGADPSERLCFPASAARARLAIDLPVLQ